MNGSNDIVIVMRNIERVDKLKLDTDSILDDKKLAKQFVLRNLKFPKSESAEDMKNYL